MTEPDERKAADILAGPGLIQRPETLARGLDDKLKEMVRELEAVADCPSPAFDLPQDLDPAGRISRFCEALARMGAPIVEELTESYLALCRSERLEPAQHKALLEQRGQALVAYFRELAQVHGVAFASEAGALSPEAVNAALAALERDLSGMLADASAKLQ